MKNIVPLRAGLAYNIRTDRSLQADVVLGIYDWPGNELVRVMPSRRSLESPHGFDLYPPHNTLLVMRWTLPVVDADPVHFRVFLLKETPEERLKKRKPVSAR